MVDLEMRCQRRGQAAHHHLPPPPGSCESSAKPRLKSSGHDPEGAVCCRWSSSLSASGFKGNVGATSIDASKAVICFHG